MIANAALNADRKNLNVIVTPALNVVLEVQTVSAHLVQVARKNLMTVIVNGALVALKNHAAALPHVGIAKTAHAYATLDPGCHAATVDFGIALGTVEFPNSPVATVTLEKSVIANR